LGRHFHEAKAQRYGRISVADTSLGMTNPFSQSKSQDKGPDWGYSTALSATKNGFLDVTREAGRGSTFKLSHRDRII
jgi:hypothetical protein